MKEETFKIAGTQHYLDNIKKLMHENADYLMDAHDIKDVFEEGDRIYQYTYDLKELNISLVPEPANKYDPNAVMVIINGIVVGYIKKGSCSHVKNLMKDANYKVFITDMGLGKFKVIWDGKVETNEVKPFIKIAIQTGERDNPQPVQQEAAPQIAQPEKPKKQSNAALITFLIIGVLFASSAPFFSLFAFIVAGILIYKRIKGKKP